MSYTQFSKLLFPFLKENFSKRKFDDDDWTLFITEEILRNQDIIATSDKLYDLISEHLIDIASTDEEQRSLCKQIYSFLKKNKLLHPDLVNSSSSSSSSEEKDEIDFSKITENEEGDDEGSYVEEGCCLMCERKMLLTFHHVVPKEVHEWYKKHHGMTKNQLNQGIMICRPCHSALHSFEDNKTLAEKYSTINAIMDHPKVQKWLPYIRKRRPIAKKDHRTLPPNGNRDMPPDYDEYDE